jgi:hypothetical protein
VYFPDIRRYFSRLRPLIFRATSQIRDLRNGSVRLSHLIRKVLPCKATAYNKQIAKTARSEKGGDSLNSGQVRQFAGWLQ